MLIAAEDIADEMPPADGWATLEQLLEFEPGPAIIAFLNALDPAEVDEASAVTVMELWQRQAAWLAERMTSSIAVVAGPTPSKEAAKADLIGDDWNIDYVGAALGLSTGSARLRVATARRLTESLPQCRAAMAAGHLTLQHLWAIVEATADLDADAIAFVDQRVASKIRGQSWPSFRRTLRRAVLAAAPDLAEAIHGTAAADRRVELSYNENDGMAEIRAIMPAVDAHTVWLALGAAADAARVADQNAGIECRAIDAYRSDALHEWAKAQLARTDAPTKHGRRVELQVVIDLPSLLGMAENPAELAGFGPIPAAIARESCCRREMATTRRRSGHRASARFRQCRLPTAAGVDRLHRGPRSAMSIPRVQPKRRLLRHRSQRASSARSDVVAKLLLPVPTTSSAEDARRVAGHDARRLQLRMDGAQRPTVLRPNASAARIAATRPRRHSTRREPGRQQGRDW